MELKHTIAVLAFIVALPGGVLATVPPAPPTAASSAPTAAELRALKAAMAADAGKSAARPPVTNAPRPSVAPANGGGATALGGAAGMASYRAQSMVGAMNPDISLILDVAGGWFSVDKPMQTGAHDPSRTGFTLQQLEMHVFSAVDPYFQMEANIVFAEFGVEVEEAYARSMALPAGLQLRAGQFLARMGRLNPTHPHSWAFADQPLVNGKLLGSEGLRGLGTELSWLTPLPWFAEVVVSTQMAGGACCARSFGGGNAQPVQTPFDLMQLVRLQQFFPLDTDWSVTWGLSAAVGPNPSGAGRLGSNRTDIFATDLYVRYRPVASRVRAALSWETEAMLRRRQVPGRLLSDWGVNSQLVWRYALRWEAGVRGEYVTGVVDDPLDPQWSGDRQRTTVQWTFYPSHFSRLRLQGSIDRPAWRSKPVYAAFVAMEVVIGAHGSHGF